MLTPTDIQILVGLLTLVTNPDDVEITVGDLVYDDKAKKRRDVDVTVTHKDKNGIVLVFKGIEVKKHKHPLDVARVEGLCCKFNDMPAINHNAIVSASGYTKSARKKAEAYGVTLYSLIPWDKRDESFEHAQLPPDFVIKQQTLSWVSSPSVIFQLDVQGANQNAEINKDATICSVDGGEIGLKTIQQLSDKLGLVAIQQLVNNEEVKKISPGVEKGVIIPFTDLSNICIDLGGYKKQIKQALVKGKVVWKEYNLSPEFKILVKDGELKPYVGCAITEMPEGNLGGITVSQVDRSIKWINIPISERHKNKIRELRLK